MSGPNDLIEKINHRLHELLPNEGLLYEAGRYVALSGGKRIRPLMTALTAQMLDCHHPEVITAACALELVHTYSLIHDDLPCMDNDDFRRGKPTLHKVYDEAHALLVGDFLLTYAFEILSSLNIDNTQKIQLIQALSKAAGASGMVGGQVLDLASKKVKVDIEELHYGKTAALFVAAVDFGAILADARPSIRVELTQFGREFGLLFQAVDDIEDGDFLEDEASARQRAAFLFQMAYQRLDHLPNHNTTPLKDIIKSLI